MSEELKPCPMCGSDKLDRDFGDESACYRCRNCGAQSGRIYFTEAELEADRFVQSEAAALEAWNRRTPPEVAAAPATSTDARSVLEELVAASEGGTGEDHVAGLLRFNAALDVARALLAQPVPPLLVDAAAAWMHPDGRVIPAATMDTARKDGGATTARQFLEASLKYHVGFDEDGSLGPAEPFTWETVARVSGDLVRAALSSPDLQALERDAAQRQSTGRIPPKSSDGAPDGGTR